MKRQLLLSVFAISLHVGVGEILGQDYQDYVGRQVMTVRWGVEARSEQKVSKLDLGEVYEVTQVDGNLVWLGDSSMGYSRADPGSRSGSPGTRRVAGSPMTIPCAIHASSLRSSSRR